MFLDNDERLLLFYQRPTPLTPESMAGFRKAGIRTIHFGARSMSWHELEPSPGNYNWGPIENVINQARQAGLKSIVDVYWRAPDWLKEGTIEIVRGPGTVNVAPDRVWDLPWLSVSPFSEYAMQAEAEFVEQACKHLTAPDVLCRYAMHYGGERILPFGLPEYTEEDCVNLVLRRQRIFAKYADELWTAFHPHMAEAITGSIDRTTHPHVGNEHLWACYDAMRKEFPNHTLNQFVTELFVHSSFNVHIEGVRVWVGAQFISGLRANAARAKDYGAYGLIMAHHGIDELDKQPTERDFGIVKEGLEILRQKYG
jgi:hypothetical protein